MKRIIYLTLLTIFLGISLHSMENDEHPIDYSTAPLIGCHESEDDTSNEAQLADKLLTVYAIPGQNGLGSSPAYIHKILGDNDIDIIEVPTPSLPDLGQWICLKNLKAVVASEECENGIIYATSQGTATALNCAAHEDKAGRIKALILEAALVSGNSAIEHTLKKPIMNKEWITDLPFSYYWVPYCAKSLFPLYWPAGKQPIKFLKKIPQNLLIIIIHSKDDMQLSYDDACALYYGLRAQGNNNVYLITKEGNRHINILNSADEAQIIRDILDHHEILKSSNTKKTDLTVYQPDHHAYEKKFNELLLKEKNHERLFCVMTIGLFCIALRMVLAYVYA